MKKRLFSVVFIIGMIAVVMFFSALPVSADTTTTDDRSASVTYGGTWGTWNGTGPYADTLTFTEYYGATADFTFTGTGVSFVYVRQPDQGSAEIYIDGSLVDTISQAGELAWQYEWSSGVLENTEHTIQVKNINTSAPLRIYVDAFIVTGDAPTPTPTSSPEPGGLRCTNADANTLWAECGAETEFADRIELAQTNSHYMTSFFDVQVTPPLAATKIYYDITINWNVVPAPGRPGGLDAATFTMSITNAASYTYSQRCNEFTCHLTGYYEIDASQNAFARFNFSLWDLWPYDETVISGGQAILSVEPIINCDQFVTQSRQELDIIPLIEFPQGPDAVSPAFPDEQIALLLPGLDYRLYTEGVWSDGTNARVNDFVISFDEGVTWIDPDDIETILCKDSNGVVFTAPSDELQIRVADAAGQFADNSDIIDTFYILEQVKELTSCGQKFSYDPEDDWISSGTISASSSEATIPTIVPDGVMVQGEWYALETAGQPWYDETSAERFDIRVTNIADAGLNSAEFSVWPFTSCVEPTGDLSHLRYYFQSPDTNIKLWVNDTVFGDGNSGNIGYNIYHVDFTYIPADCEASFVINDKIVDSSVSASAANGMKMVPNDPTNSFTKGLYYMIQTKGGPWRSPVSLDLWDMSVQHQNATAYGDEYPLATWPNGVCYSETDMLGHERVYFEWGGENEEGNIWQDSYYMRVNNDTGYDYNELTGDMDFEVWEVTQVTPPTGACGNISKSDYKGLIPVAPDQSTGEAVTFMVTDQAYALETTGWWKEGGLSGDPWSVASISDDNGETWYNWPAYPAKICFEVFAEGGREYYRLYIRSQAGRTYKVRASDVDTVWSNNEDTNNFGVKVYDAQVITDPHNECTEHYGLTKIQSNVRFPSHIDTGARTIIEAGKLYAVDIVNGYWQSDGGEKQYTAQMSFDSGAADSFYSFDDRNMPGFRCFAQHPLYQRVYFMAANTGGLYAHIRVGDDTDADWTNNTGELLYDLYSAVDTEDPEDPDDPDGPGCPGCQPPDQVAGCYTTPMRPAFPVMAIALVELKGAISIEVPDFPEAPSITDIPAMGQWLWNVFGFAWLTLESVLQNVWDNLGIFFNWATASIPAMINSIISDLGRLWNYAVGWLEYIRVSATGFFLWCPEHTAAVVDMYNQVQQREPFFTFIKIKGFIVATKMKFDSYAWGVGNNSAVVPFMNAVSGSQQYTAANQNPSFLKSVAGDLSSPYNGGLVQIRPTTTLRSLRGAGTDYTVCTANIKSTWGTSGLSKGFCLVMNLTKAIEMDYFINSLIVISAIIIFLNYFIRKFLPMLDPNRLILGNKGKK